MDTPGITAKVKNQKWTDEQLFHQRKDVLARWQTGKEIDLDEALAYRKALPESTQWVPVLSRARQEGRVLLSMYVGHASVEDTLAHLKLLQENGVDLLHILPDTYTRRGRFAQVASSLQGSTTLGKSVLNGYPIVNHGLARARYIRDNVGIPVVVNNSDSEYCELSTEMSLAAGFERSSGDIETLLRASKSFPMETKIIENQYTNRLTGYYTERGAPVMTNLHNCFCGLDPPEVKIAVGVLHSLLAAEQGVKFISQEVSLGCHVIQDVAAHKVARELTEEYLKKFGYRVEVFLKAYPYGAMWPREQNRASATGALNVIIPILAGVDCLPVKSFHEAIGIPTKEANLMAFRQAKHLVKVIGRQRLESGDELKTEMEMIRLGASAIIEKTLELGDGDAAVGQIKAVERGVIDVAFSPYTKAQGKAFPMRDATGAIRYADAGNIPLPPEVLDYHHRKIAEREKREPGKKRYEMMIEDVYHLAD